MRSQEFLLIGCKWIKVNCQLHFGLTLTHLTKQEAAISVEFA